MKLLIITQKVDSNDDILGFFHRWIEEFAKHCEKVTVICLQEGEYHLPDNVKVLSLGKKKNPRINLWINPWILLKLTYIYNFYKYIWQERKNYDNVFVHMNPEYVVLGGLFWRLWRKKIALWYAHGHVTIILQFAQIISHIIFTSTKSGFRLLSKKIKIIGQGIDINYFQPLEKKSINKIFTIVTIGRVSPIKDYETLISAIEVLIKEKKNVVVNIVGGVGLEKQVYYLNELKGVIENKKLTKNINFIGATPHKDIIQYLYSADLFVNMSHTGSLDKAILEAMACELPILTCNEALKEVLGDYKDILIYQKQDYIELTKKIKNIINMPISEHQIMVKSLRNIIKDNHSITQLIKKINDEFDLL